MNVWTIAWAIVQVSGWPAGRVDESAGERARARRTVDERLCRCGYNSHMDAFEVVVLTPGHCVRQRDGETASQRASETVGEQDSR